MDDLTKMAGLTRNQASAALLGAAAVPEEKKHLDLLSDILVNIKCRLREGINRYGRMNDMLVGHMPQTKDDSLKDEPHNGQLIEAINEAQIITDLLNNLDDENNRLNTVVIDN